MRPPLLIAVLLGLSLAAVARAEPPEVEATPGHVVLGKDTAVVVRVRVPRGAGPVRAAASSGTWDAARVEGGAERVFRWTPPAVRHPLWAVLAFWVEDGRPPEVTPVLIPLLGRTTLDVSTAPGAEVVVAVGDARFGPVTADARGRAQVPVEVPPDTKEARVLATRGALTTDRSAPLAVPAQRPLVVALTPDPLSPEDGGWLILAGLDGTVPASELELTAEGATLKAEPSAKRARFTVHPREGASRVSVTASWRQVDPSAEPLKEVRAEAGVLPARPRPQTPTEVTALPSPAPSPVAAAQRAAGERLSLFLLGGATFARGANDGPLLSLGVSVPLPVWHGRLAAEAEAGLRYAMFDARTEPVHSRVWGVPLLLSARIAVFQQGSFRLDGRAGGGVLPFSHRLTDDATRTPDDFPATVDERRVAAMGFLSVQGAYDFGRWSLLTEVRGALAPIETPSLRAQLGGVSVSAGLRFVP
ncbi:hypothetical protein G4177_30205 [Corallococcus sp. ZKHCc1 1396]|uniref:Carboxypeptidase regulatory-like domain-containing protein n=1 Tax=Corallococcus soli TaxID=2710757 RepID=A0ABR9PWZ8_9BACT|nr:hypothetical protein [Corallococcus soli]MBE4752448.1 hypothetical protein [Corallococcus soli]